MKKISGGYIGNLKITYKVCLLTGIPLFFLVIVSAFAAVSLKNQKQALTEIVEVRNPHLQLAGFLYEQVLFQRILLDSLLKQSVSGTDDDVMQSMEKTVRQSLSSVISDVEKALSSADFTAGEKLILDSLVQFTKRYQTSTLHALRFAKNPSFLSMNLGVALNHFESLKDKVVQLKRYENELSESRYTHTLANSSTALKFLLILTSVVFIVSCLALVFVSRLITAPLKKCVSFALSVAQGDLSHSMESGSRDELGDLAHALNTMKTSLRDIIKSVQTGSQSLAQSSTVLKASFTTLAGNTENMKSKSISVASATEEAAASFTSITTRIKAVSQSVNFIHGSIEKLSATFAEVSKLCHNEVTIVTQADEQSVKTKEIIQGQNAAAGKIEGISGIITHIADRTKLLSLNARIQAASAGEAGKGFAVVASEIKDLSTQTGTATGEISSNIKEMQKSSMNIIAFIETIFSIIKEINSISQHIVESIEEQFTTVNNISKNLNDTNNASQEISSNITEAAKGIGSIAESMHSVDSTIAEVSQEASVLQENVKIIEELSTNLNKQISQFKL